MVIEYRSADGRAERFAAASELVGLNVDLILARGTPATTAVQNATGTIPVVMVTMGGPGAIVASFARPAGNITGVITFSTELTAKRVEILKDLAPGLTRVADTLSGYQFECAAKVTLAPHVKKHSLKIERARRRLCLFPFGGDSWIAHVVADRGCHAALSAKALGLDVPPTLLATADEVIE